MASNSLAAPSESQLAAIGAKLNAAAADLDAIRSILRMAVNDTPDICQIESLMFGADAMVVRAGRAVDRCAQVFGQRPLASWQDYERSDLNHDSGATDD